MKKAESHNYKSGETVKIMGKCFTVPIGYWIEEIINPMEICIDAHGVNHFSETAPIRENNIEESRLAAWENFFDTFNH